MGEILTLYPQYGTCTFSRHSILGKLIICQMLLVINLNWTFFDLDALYKLKDYILCVQKFNKKLKGVSFPFVMYGICRIAWPRIKDVKTSGCEKCNYHCVLDLISSTK